MKLTGTQKRLLSAVRSRSQYAADARAEGRTTARGRCYTALVKQGLVDESGDFFILSIAGAKALEDSRPAPKPRKALPKTGKKTDEWAEIRTKELKPAFKRAKVTECELKWSGCMKDNYLGFAHSQRRRNITTPEQMREVVLACTNCHDALDLRPHEETEAIVQSVIRARKRAVVLA